MYLLVFYHMKHATNKPHPVHIIFVSDHPTNVTTLYCPAVSGTSMHGLVLTGSRDEMWMVNTDYISTIYNMWEKHVASLWRRIYLGFLQLKG